MAHLFSQILFNIMSIIFQKEQINFNTIKFHFPYNRMYFFDNFAIENHK